MTQRFVSSQEYFAFNAIQIGRKGLNHLPYIFVEYCWLNNYENFNKVLSHVLGRRMQVKRVSAYGFITLWNDIGEGKIGG